MAIRTDFTAGEVLAAADLNDTFGAKLNLAGGKILQIVRATDSTARTTTSGTYADVTGMTVTITPQKSNSAVIILASFDVFIGDFTGIQAQADYQITDSSNNAISGAQRTRLEVTGPSGNTTLGTKIAMFAYSTPATTSAVSYKLRHRVETANDTTTVGNGATTGQMYAIEVSA